MKHSISSRDSQFHPCYVSFSISSTLCPTLHTLWYSAMKNYFVSLISFAPREDEFFFRRRQVRFEERNARRETAVSVLHKAKLRKSTMDMKKKHCQGSKKQREREKREREIQQHLVIARKSEIPAKKGAGWRRRRSRREREERNCEHVQNGTRVIILPECSRARLTIARLYWRKSRRRERIPSTGIPSPRNESIRRHGLARFSSAPNTRRERIR